MLVVKPEKITDSNLVSDIVEPDTSENVWEDKPYKGSVLANTSGDYWNITSITFNGTEFAFNRIDSSSTIYLTAGRGFNSPTALFSVAGDISSGYITGVTFYDDRYYVSVRDTGVHKVLIYSASGVIINSFDLDDIDTNLGMQDLCANELGLTVFVLSSTGEYFARRLSFAGVFIDEFSTGYTKFVGAEYQDGFYYTVTTYSIAKYTQVMELVSSELISAADSSSFRCLAYDSIGDSLLTAAGGGGATPQDLIRYHTNLATINFYEIGDELISTTTHKKYNCVISTIDTPEVGAVKDTPTWTAIGYSNKYSMFDGVIGTQATKAECIEITLTPGKAVSSIAAFNVNASSITITMNDPINGEVYNNIIDLQDFGGVNDFYGYFFSPLTTKHAFSLFDLPAYPNATITAVFDNAGGTAAVGELVIGQQINLGTAELGTSLGLIDYSVKEIDDFGNFKVTKRRNSKRVNFIAYTDTSLVPYVYDQLSQLTTTPCVWSGSDVNDSTLVYGYYKDCSLVITQKSVSTLSLEIEGLT